MGTALGAGAAFGTATGQSIPIASGMRIGTQASSTAAVKSGTGAAL
ncbi:hypothetical protein [Arthrobacter sp. PAMC25564]|nr:hypothetical protein [Arthrobacter sp. PAMC25564]